MGRPSWILGVWSYSKVDETQRLLQRLLLGGSVVVVGLLVELCHVLHHLHHNVIDELLIVATRQ